MKCPVCRSESHVTDSRKRRNYTARRRECMGCGRRFTTKERIDVPAEPAEPTMTLEKLSEQIAEVAMLVQDLHRRQQQQRQRKSTPKWPKPDPYSLTQAELDARNGVGS